jgi:predicted nucleic acid-binding protein
MFLLDTNILSAVMGSRPAPEVATWMAGHPPDLLFTAAVCQSEILSGIAVLPKGRRRATGWSITKISHSTRSRERRQKLPETRE